MIRHFTRQSRGTEVPRLTADARAVQMGAFDHASRMGHPYKGGEHVLLALAGAGHPAPAVLREHGVTPERVEGRIIELWGGGMFGDLDPKLLAALGIDVDAVRARTVDSFGPTALHRAAVAQRAHEARRRRHSAARWDPRRRRGQVGAHRDGVFLPSGPGAFQCLHYARLAAEEQHDSQIDVGHFALGLLSVTEGLVPSILAALLDAPVPALRTAVQHTLR
jgi:Clp amino terminal domain, pathogenicity island component